MCLDIPAGLDAGGDAGPQDLLTCLALPADCTTCACALALFKGDQSVCVPLGCTENVAGYIYVECLAD